MAGGSVRSNRLRSFELGVAVLCVAAMLLLVPGVADAQARLISSTPEDGANVSNLEEVTFEFDILLFPDGAEVQVLRRDGTEIPVRSVTVDRTLLTATLDGQLTSGNYEVAYSVQSSDGRLNAGSIRVSVASPDQALSGGLLLVLGLGFVMFGVMFFVLWRDQKRRPGRRV